MSKKAVILFSGGLDSTTVVKYAESEGFDCNLITYNYGQRHSIETEKAIAYAKKLQIKNHKIVTIDLRLFGGSALTDNIDVPKHKNLDKIDEKIPSTYVPARNTIFLAYATAFAETIGAYDIFYGANIIDYSHYTDCRPEFINAFEEVAYQGTKAVIEGKRFKIHAPLIELSKKEIIKLGLSLGVDYSMTHSCYDPDINGKPCQNCESCLFRAKGFEELSMQDPALA